MSGLKGSLNRQRMMVLLALIVGFTLFQASRLLGTVLDSQEWVAGNFLELLTVVGGLVIVCVIGWLLFFSTKLKDSRETAIALRDERMQSINQKSGLVGFYAVMGCQIFFLFTEQYLSLTAEMTVRTSLLVGVIAAGGGFFVSNRE